MGVMRPIVASVVGLASESNWGQVFQSPHSYGVVEIVQKDGDARKKGIALLTELTRLLETPPISLAALNDLADTVIDGEVVSLILLVPVGSTLYVVSRGKGCLYLKRDSQFARLLSGMGSLSGSMKEGDVFVAATDSFLVLSQNEILGVFDHLEPPQVAEKLTLLLHRIESGAGGCALILKMPHLSSQSQVSHEPVKHRNRNVVIQASKIIGKRFLPAGLRTKLRSFIGHMRKKSWSKRKIITTIIIALFITSVVLGLQKQWQERTNTRFAGVLSEASHAYEEGLALMDLNPVKGRERLTHARNLLLPILSQPVRVSSGKTVKEFYDDIEASLNRAMQVHHATPQLYFDMGLLKKGAIATDITIFGGTLGILDGPGATAYTLGIDNKKGAILAGGSPIASGTQVSLYGDFMYVWTDRGITQVQLSDQNVIERIIPASSEWGNITDMVAFGGNLYLLDTQKSRIWKYVASTQDVGSGKQGFSELFEYLNPDTLPDLSQAISMSIDGSVWLGTQKGDVMRFTSGKENRYVVQGEDYPLGSAVVPYVHDEATFVYILDKHNRRVVIYDKDGLYISQYTWEEEINPTQIVVSEVYKKIFLLANGKIYSLDVE